MDVMTRTTGNKATGERNAEILRSREQGESYVSIGKRYNISAGRVKVICDDLRRMVKNNVAPDYDEVFLVVTRTNADKIAIKEVMMINESRPEHVSWRNPGSNVNSRVNLTNWKILGSAGTLKEAEEMVENIMLLTDHEKFLHNQRLEEILYTYSENSI